MKHTRGHCLAMRELPFSQIVVVGFFAHFSSCLLIIILLCRYVLMSINFLQQRRPAILPCLQVRVFIAFSNYKNTFQVSGILV